MRYVAPYLVDVFMPVLMHFKVRFSLFDASPLYIHGHVFDFEDLETNSIIFVLSTP